jgi:predicted nucleic-acid-binding Zn-ribbon protein
MKSGRCPKCGAEAIRAGTQVATKHENIANRLPVTAFRSAALDNYVCVACGYVEHYIADADKLDLIAEQWPIVEPVSDEEEQER